MHLADPIFIFILALVLLGPKKTAELANQLGKLMGEFRKASTDFKFQFNEEMRITEQQEQQKKQEAERATLTAGSASGETENAADAEEHTILPPGDEAVHGEDEAVPYAISATTGEEYPVEDHPLLRVDEIPPMDGTPGDQTGNESGDETGDPTITSEGNAAAPDAEGNGRAPRENHGEVGEEDGAQIHHG